MKLQLNDETLKVTTDCEKGFSCLNGDSECMCQLESCIKSFSDTVYFVKPLNDETCFYKHCFGMGHYCTCPIRIAIHDKYKK